MSDYNSLKATIDANIKQNNNQAITGNVLNAVLNDMVNSLGSGYQYIGIATPQTIPGSPDEKVFYLAGAGSYPNFGNVTIDEGYIGILSYHNSAWSASSIKVGKDIEIVDNLTDGGRDKALSAEQGKILKEMFGEGEVDVPFFINSSSAAWETGNIYRGELDTYANQRLILQIPQEAKDNGSCVVRFGASPTYKLKICTSLSSNTGFTDLVELNTSNEEQSYTIDVTSANYIGLVLFDRPTTAQAKAIPLRIVYQDILSDPVLRLSDIVNDLTTGGAGKALSAEMGKELASMIQIDPQNVILFDNDGYTWITGNINPSSLLPQTYANKIALIDLPDAVSLPNRVRVQKASSSVNLSILVTADQLSYVKIGDYQGEVDVNVNVQGYNRVVLICWKNSGTPTEQEVEAEDIVVSYNRGEVLLNDKRVAFPGVEAEIVSQSLLNRDLLASSFHHYHIKGEDWLIGSLNNSTGGWVSGQGNISPTFPVNKGDKVIINYDILFGYDVIIWTYNSDGTAQARLFPVKDKEMTISLTTDTGWLRLSIRCFSGFPATLTTQQLEDFNFDVYLPVEVSRRTYRNPIIMEDLPDPTIWDGEDGYYYLLGTNLSKSLDNITLYRSRNFVDWEAIGRPPFTSATAAILRGSAVLNGDVFWAADVKKIRPGVWNMYLCKPTNGGWGGIAVLTSSHPTFGFEFVRFMTPDREEFIDPFVEYDFDGKLWMILGAAGIYRREMNSDGTDFAAGSSWTHMAGLSRNAPDNPNLQKTFEGACLYYRQGYWYLFVSAGNWTTSNYNVKVCRSASLTGAYVDRNGNPSTDGSAEEVLSTLDGYLYGPGHHAPLVADFGNKTWMIFHSHCAALNDSGKRAPCITEIVWDADGWPSARYKHPMVFGEGTDI